MTLEQWAYLAEIVGVVLVIASLVYVARQLRQNTEVMRAESRNEIFHGHQQELFALVANPDVWSSFVKAELTESERVRFNGWLTASIRAREHEWFQYQNGAIERTAWESYSNVIPIVLGTERSRRWWEFQKQSFDPGFVAVADGMIEERPYAPVFEQILHLE